MEVVGEEGEEAKAPKASARGGAGTKGAIKAKSNMLLAGGIMTAGAFEGRVSRKRDQGNHKQSQNA